MGKTYQRGLDVLGGDSDDGALVVYGDVVLDRYAERLRSRPRSEPRREPKDDFGGILVRVLINAGVLLVMFFLDGAWRHVRLRP